MQAWRRYSSLPKYFYATDYWGHRDTIVFCKLPSDLATKEANELQECLNWGTYLSAGNIYATKEVVGKTLSWYTR